MLPIGYWYIPHCILMFRCFFDVFAISLQLMCHTGVIIYQWCSAFESELLELMDVSFYDFGNLVRSCFVSKEIVKVNLWQSYCEDWKTVGIKNICYNSSWLILLFSSSSISSLIFNILNNKWFQYWIVLYCPASTHNSTTFYTHTWIHTLKLTHWLPRHTTRRLLSTTLRATSEGYMTKCVLPLLTSPCWQGGD